MNQLLRRVTDIAETAIFDMSQVTVIIRLVTIFAEIFVKRRSAGARQSPAMGCGVHGATLGVLFFTEHRANERVPSAASTG
ncbi:MAG TPA: hypothetical protein VG937_04375 [Polyangiaceae bacterium]|nr:hypothetical protein [Polyangiaceae bacterium]